MVKLVNSKLKEHFKPEFLNRVDNVVVFPQLTQDEIIQIVDLMVARLDERMRDKDMGIELTDAAKKLLAEQAATTRSSVPGRCAAPSSARSRTRCPRRSCSARSRRARSSAWTLKARACSASSRSRASQGRDGGRAAHQGPCARIGRQGWRRQLAVADDGADDRNLGAHDARRPRLPFDGGRGLRLASRCGTSSTSGGLRDKVSG